MITLTHVDGTRLYQAEHSPDPGFLTYYVSDPQVPTEKLPASLKIDDAWYDRELHGYFLFLTKEPTDIQLFARAVAEHGFGVPDHASFAWVQYQESPRELTAAYQLDLKPGEPPGSVVIKAPAMFRFGNYGLPFMQDGLVQAVSVADDGIQQFRFGYPFAYPSGGPSDLPPDLPQTEGTGVNVPLLGPQRYVLQSLALVADFSNDAVHGFEVGLRYFYETGGKVLSQFYPIFAPRSGSQIEFKINWDPLDPLNRKRSWMKFTGNAYLVTITGEGQGTIEVAEDANVLPTWLRTVYGKPLWLRPVLEGEHEARLVMQPKPADKPNETAYYMVPDGDYEVIAGPTDNSIAELNLLCGLAGTESIGFRPGPREAPLTTIRFHSWMPAFAPVFPLTDAAGGLASSGALRSEALANSALLTDAWPTAWLSVGPTGIVPDIKTTYYAQPEQAALYDAKENAPAADVLELYQAPVAKFDSGSLDQPYPMAIYAGLAGTQVSGGLPAEDLRKFEVQILNSVRKGTIAAISARQRVLAVATKDPPPPLVTTTTPQGLVAQVQGLEWKSVLLAHSKDDNSKLEFTNLPPELREALQSNQMFLVASLKEPLGSFEHNITLAGWPFDIDVGKGGDSDYQNVLIFKFGRGAIKDLVTDPKSWTSASVFNKDPGLMSVFLQNYIANAETSAQENHRFKKFVNIVSNPAWEGILALRVTVGLNKFPEDLKGLLAGIDLTKFVAHHFGIETSFVKADGTLKQAKSSLFGLISYIDGDYTSRQSIQAFHSQDQLITHVPPVVPAVDPTSELYDFKVLQLEVVFENTELLDFTSKIQLTTTKWFGETATLQSGYPPDPIDSQSIDLNGSYEMHNGQRSYSFYTDPSQTYKFLIASHVLNYVQIVKARFETLRSERQADASENIFTRFSFWGYLNFKKLQGFDLFSFGSEANPELSEKQGLYFSNFGITMDFKLLANQTTIGRTFAFDAGTASYDISQSQMRQNSLVNRFPMKVTSILQSEGRASPTDLGYLPVRVPELQVPRVSTDWYAVNFELNLGSMGALAEKAGFAAALLLAWSPSESSARAEVQIKLPGMGGGKKLLSLQGVLKLSIQYFEFTTKTLAIDDVQYQLTFRNAGLSLLGKKLPTTGTIDMILLGDPNRKLDAGSLSWFAKYAPEEKSALAADSLIEP